MVCFHNRRHRTRSNYFGQGHCRWDAPIGSYRTCRSYGRRPRWGLTWHLWWQPGSRGSRFGFLAGKAKHIGEVITEHFTQAQKEDSRIGDIRGRGAMMAIKFVDPETKEPLAKLVNDIAVEARKQGVITLTAGTYGNVLRFLPPV